MNELFTKLNLQLFAEGGGAAGGDGGGEGGAEGAEGAPVAPAKKSRNPLADVQYGTNANPETIVTSNTQVDRNAEFENLIKGEYKAEYDSRVQKAINSRFKEMNALKEKATQFDSMSPVLDLLANKYGVTSKNTQDIIKAIEEDDSYYEDEALEKGLTVEQLKHMKRIERENADFKKAVEDQRRANAQQQVFQRWDTESAQCKQIYPGFDFDQEANNPETGKRFLSLLGAGLSVKDSFEVIHKDDIFGGAMQYTAQQVAQKTVNDIRARGLRPSENGTSGSAPAQIVKKDPAKFSKRDREEISRRVLRGDRSITFD